VTSALALDDRGHGPALVLLHGLATTRLIWRRVVPLLGDGRRLLAVDVPGFGESPPAGPGFELDSVAACIDDGLAEAGVTGDYDLVGHSMGGALAVALAALRPGRVRRLVLCAPAGLRATPGWAARGVAPVAEQAIRLRRALAPLADPPWGRRLLLGWGVVDATAIAPSEVRAMVGASRGASRIAPALAQVASADLRDALARLPAPVGAIWGEGDRVISPARADVLRSVRPEAPVEVVRDAGHIAMMERPEAFAAAVERVLQTLSTP
jgi:pimeloyl-ACP methyl ester carboxylesterase